MNGRRGDINDNFRLFNEYSKNHIINNNYNNLFLKPEKIYNETQFDNIEIMFKLLHLLQQENPEIKQETHRSSTDSHQDTSKDYYAVLEVNDGASQEDIK